MGFVLSVISFSVLFGILDTTLDDNICTCVITRRTAGTDDPDHNEDAWPWKKRDSAGAGNNPAEEVPDDASWLRLSNPSPFIGE